MLFLNSQTHENNNFLIYILVLTCFSKIACKTNFRDTISYLRIDLITFMYMTDK